MMLGDFRRLWGLWAPHRGSLIAGLILAALAGLLGLALMVMAGAGISAAIAGSGVVALIWLRPLVLLRPAARWAERMQTHSATFRALAETRVWFFRRLAERLPSGLGMQRAGDLLARLVSDVEALDGLYLRSVAPSVAGFAMLAAIAVLLLPHPVLMVVVVAPLMVALVLPPILAPGTIAAARSVAEGQSRLRAAVIDPLSGLEDTLAANAEGRALRVAAEASGALAATQKRLSRRAAWSGAAGTALAQLALLAAMAWGLASATEHGLHAALPAIVALFLVVAATEIVAVLPRAGAALAAAASGARRLFAAADLPVPVPDPAIDPAHPQPTPQGFDIAFRRVEFTWAPDRARVFTGLDLDIPAGTRLAILGPSGIGKSTLAALLLKLAAPQEGEITLGGVSLSALSGAAARSIVTCLTQEARLFDDSIAANLRIAAPDAPEAALWRALDQAGIGDVVRALPEGLETRCGEAGQRFSGGQARRLSLARALLSAAPVLILDEPAAGLDAAAEEAFLATLAEATAGRTVILIAHRLLGMERPDRIIRLAGGRAVAAMG